MNSNPFNPLAEKMIADIKKAFSSNTHPDDSYEYIAEARVQIMYWFVVTAVFGGIEPKYIKELTEHAVQQAENAMNTGQILH